jgi:hypothetical protein
MNLYLQFLLFALAGWINRRAIAGAESKQNSYAERWIRSVRGVCLSRVIPRGERHLRYLLSEYLVHSHQERNHQGLDNRLIETVTANTNSGEGVVRRHERVGGLLSYYHRDAARFEAVLVLHPTGSAFGCAAPRFAP